MISEEELSLMIQSVLDDFNCCPDSLQIYLKTSEKSLKEHNFQSVFFCFSKIYNYYNLDENNSSSFTLFINTKNQLQKYLEESNRLSIEKKKLFRFWTSFIEWYKALKRTLSPYFLDKFIYGHYEEDYYERSNWIDDGIDCNEELYYKILYGENIPTLTIDNINIEDIKNYIEMIYCNFLKSGKNGKYPFSVYVNETFSKFGLSYKIKNGKIKSETYKTTNFIDKILNYEQFERKILFSEQMILHNDLMDKHAALEYIADSYCYFVSLFKGSRNEKNKAIANLVYNDVNSNLYKEIEKEADNIYLIVNGNYDIRHNEYYNTKTSEPREPLNDCAYIEYLYNRIYAFLFLLRLKYHDIDSHTVAIIDDDLPF